MCAKQLISMVVIMQNKQDEANLQNTKLNATKQERFMQTEIIKAICSAVQAAG